MVFKSKMKFIDATLREGTQAPGVYFSNQQVVSIAEKLAEAGTDMLEVGHPLVSENAMLHVRSVVKLNLGLPILSHARAHKADIAAVADSGADWVGIFLGVNELTEQVRLQGYNYESLLERVVTSIEYARKLGLKIRYTIEDASRTSLDRLLKTYSVAVSEGVERICFADSVGILEPKKTFQLMNLLRQKFPTVELEAHFHNDRGLSIANAIEAHDCGVDWISVSVNGLGERCGITDHGVLAINLHHRGDREISATQGSVLKELSEMIEEHAKQPLGKSSPIFGRYAFCHTARLHVKAMKKNPKSYQWIDPVLIGQKCQLEDK
ncbi:LeuA family protein [Photorhabdus luminescens]|uniref:LeuA family protein n=1 Tax=Photorhabdus luminescens TaxID=29488 RepID=UPI00223F55F5|nr:hypothetical protein [Photorhabdus luminescens]MCW7762565.1 hypothetical protein [Photorhabdus luminescens subsp. venezuelensis]